MDLGTAYPRKEAAFGHKDESVTRERETAEYE
jgi:hypothetical protein